MTFGPNPVWRYGHADQIVEPDDCASTPQPYQPVFRRRGWRGRGLGADLPRDKPGQERVDSRKVATVLAAQYHPAFAVPDFALLSALCDQTLGGVPTGGPGAFTRRIWNRFTSA